jgi:hypothetical protein
MLSRLAGLALQLAAGFAYVVEFRVRVDPTPILNGDCVGAVLVGLAALFSSHLLAGTDLPSNGRDKAPLRGAVHRVERLLGWPLLAWGSSGGRFAGLLEIHRFGERRPTPTWSTTSSTTCASCSPRSAAPPSPGVAYRRRWRQALSAGLLLLPLARWRC